MTREELIQKWSVRRGLIGFDWPDELRADFDSLDLSLPPADATAEAFIRAKIADNKLHDCYPTFVPEMAQMLTEFAAQRQLQPTADKVAELKDISGNEHHLSQSVKANQPMIKTAEGAEEIRKQAKKTLFCLYEATRIGEPMAVEITIIENALKEFATLTADKIVEGKLREELIAFDLFANVSETPPYDEDDTRVAIQSVEKFLKGRQG